MSDDVEAVAREARAFKDSGEWQAKTSYNQTPANFPALILKTGVEKL